MGMLRKISWGRILRWAALPGVLFLFHCGLKTSPVPPGQASVEEKDEEKIFKLYGKEPTDAPSAPSASSEQATPTPPPRTEETPEDDAGGDTAP